jgi:hypothetical protein
MLVMLCKDGLEACQELTEQLDRGSAAVAWLQLQQVDCKKAMQQHAPIMGRIAAAPCMRTLDAAV